MDGELHFEMENQQQLLEPAFAGRGQEGLPHLTLFSSGACRLLGGLYLPAGAAGEHSCRVGGFSENGADLREELVTRCC
ncbi:hypothetical protein [Streptomyces rochei]|uniref:hypothetical protein n=1 Tax=Streptomyces rochei TaxID=1928 RepID=UPI0036C1D0F7